MCGRLGYALALAPQGDGVFHDGWSNFDTTIRVETTAGAPRLPPFDEHADGYEQQSEQHDGRQHDEGDDAGVGCGAAPQRGEEQEEDDAGEGHRRNGGAHVAHPVVHHGRKLESRHDSASP